MLTAGQQEEHPTNKNLCHIPEGSLLEQLWEETKGKHPMQVYLKNRC